MRAKIVRSLTYNEVVNRISEIEKRNKWGVNTPNPNGKLFYDASKTEDYEEWRKLRDAIEAFREGEGFDYNLEEELEVSETDMKLTIKRIELIDFISKTRINSINNLASKVGRDVKNVYKDLKILERMGLVRLVKQGKR
ncbi:hypothetical protein KEJ47_09325, partial [Candidatus Bathyarchaeota archaeon]|nr:hypothetical protein [Candidatus Bathyarchaeota archaeon]